MFSDREDLLAFHTCSCLLSTPFLGLLLGQFCKLVIRFDTSVDRRASCLVELNDSNKSDQANNSRDASSFGTDSSASSSPGELTCLLSIGGVEIAGTDKFVPDPTDICQ